jgi:hypothetical protein
MPANEVGQHGGGMARGRWMHDRRGTLIVSLLAACLCVFAGSAWCAMPVNVAPEAVVTASAQFDASYGVANVSDGVVPDAMGHNDAGRAWCVPQAQAVGAELVFAWTAPVMVAELAYYGRTAWQWVENFREYAVFVNGADTPAVTGSLAQGHGPQRIRLPEPVRATTLRIQFLSHYGGSNPGASEVGIYADFLPDTFYEQFMAAQPVKAKTAVDYEVEGAPLPFETRELLETLASGNLGFDEIVTVHRRMIDSSHVYTYHCEDFHPGGGLYRWRAGGEPVLLVDAGQGQILDCDLSYDGTEVLFSWKRGTADTYQVFRIHVDGSGLTQLTNDAGIYNFNAAWLPDGRIVFLSTRKAAFAYCWNAPVGTLYTMDRDGADARRISANYLNDFTPAVLDDGRLIYGRWEYVDRPAIPIQGLWTLHPDGTNLRTFYGNRVIDPGSFLYARSIPESSGVLCLLTSHNGSCLGAIGIVDPRQGVNAQEAIRNITPEVSIGRVDSDEDLGNHIWSKNWDKPLYTSPCPVDDRYFLVTRAGAVVLRDYDGTEQVALLEPRDGMGFYDARPLMPRQQPPVLPSNLPEDPAPVAYVYLQDVYEGLGEHVQRGEVASIRVVQEVEKPVCVSPSQRAFGFQFPVVSCGATYAPKLVWGEAPVNADGSAAFEVPAGAPIYFMALDAEGRAVQRMRSFTHLMPGERQGCIGCHEPRGQSGRVDMRPVAFAVEPHELTPPEWGLAGFSYPDIVQPVLDQHCVSCHGPRDAPKGLDLSGDKTEFFNVSYEFLARMGTPAENHDVGGAQYAEFQNPYTKWIPTYNGSEENLLEITPNYWGSPASRLAEIVASGHPDENDVPRIDLQQWERRRIYAWIDLNVPYYGTSDSNNLEALGCRYIEPGLGEVFREVAERRCAPCHEGGDVPRRFFTRVSHFENDPILLAPLAKQAGGVEACGEAVFLDTRDPDYQRILSAAEHALAEEQRNPRVDMAEAKQGPLTGAPARDRGRGQYGEALR